MRKITYREAVLEALREEMRRDERVYLLGEDIAEFGGSYKTTQGLLQEFGRERVRNTPISEAAIIGAPWVRPCWGCARWPRSCTSTSPASPWTRS